LVHQPEDREPIEKDANLKNLSKAAQAKAVELLSETKKIVEEYNL